LIAQQCNIIVAENCLKFGATEPQQNQFSWGSPDALAQFCQQNGILFRGHCLVWHQALPSWVTSGSFNRQQMLDILKNHINNVVGRYKGKIVEWDVVNEAIDDVTYGLRSTVWKDRIGDDYLDSAFIYAHRVDSNAVLYYNDYSGEGLGNKSDAIYNLVAGMKQRGVPVHGVGLQFHTMIYSPMGDIDANIKRLGALGLKVSITELDISVPLPSYPQYFLQQGRDYKTLMQIFLANRPVCTHFITWGITDKYYWHASTSYGDPLIFDANYQPKSAYDSLISVMTVTAAITAPSVDRPAGTRPAVLCPGNIPNPLAKAELLRLMSGNSLKVYDLSGAPVGPDRIQADSVYLMSVEGKTARKIMVVE
jgi:endo-1,4-beta-xylanase